MKWNFARPKQKPYKRGQRPQHRKVTGARADELENSLATITADAPKAKGKKR